MRRSKSIRKPSRDRQPRDVEIDMLAAIDARLRMYDGWQATYGRGRRASLYARMKVQAIKSSTASDAIAWAEALCAPAAAAEVAVRQLEDAGRDAAAADIQADLPAMLSFEKAWLKIIAAAVMSDDDYIEMADRHLDVGSAYGCTEKEAAYDYRLTAVTVQASGCRRSTLS